MLGTPDYDSWEWVWIEKAYGIAAPGGYADEHISHYTRKGLLEDFAKRGYRHEATRYILRGELILAFRKPPRDDGESPPANSSPVAADRVCSVALLAPLVGPLLSGRVFVYNDLSVVSPADAASLSAGIAGRRLGAVDAVDLCRTVFARRRARSVCSIRSISCCTACCRSGVGIQPRADRQLPGGVRRERSGSSAGSGSAGQRRCSALCSSRFPGFNLLHHHHMNMVAVVAHMPWLLAAADVLIVNEAPAQADARVRRDRR